MITTAEEDIKERSNTSSTNFRGNIDRTPKSMSKIPMLRNRAQVRLEHTSINTPSQLGEVQSREVDSTPIKFRLEKYDNRGVDRVLKSALKNGCHQPKKDHKKVHFETSNNCPISESPLFSTPLKKIGFEPVNPSRVKISSGPLRVTRNAVLSTPVKQSELDQAQKGTIRLTGPRRVNCRPETPTNGKFHLATRISTPRGAEIAVTIGKMLLEGNENMK